MEIENHGEKLAFERRPQVLRPVSGWLLDAAFAIDEVQDGFLRAVVRSRASWRQSFAAALASGLIDNPTIFLERVLHRPMDGDDSWRKHLIAVAEILPALTPVEIIEAAFGWNPSMTTVLAKLGYDPMAKETYLGLFNLLNEKSETAKARVKVLMQARRLSEGEIAAILQIDPIFLHPSIMAVLNTPWTARQANESVGLIQSICSTASDDALRESLTSPVHFRLDFWVRNWLNKADQGGPEMNLPADHWEIITPATAKRVSIEFRNCLRHRAAKISGGVWAAAIYKPLGLIATFVRLEPNGWVMTGIYARGNCTVEAEKEDAVRAAVLALGPEWHVAGMPFRDRVAALNVLSGYGLGIDDDDFDLGV